MKSKVSRKELYNKFYDDEPKHLDPFRTETSTSTLQKLQILFMSLTVAPIRFVLMVLITLFIALTTQIVLTGQPKDQPLLGWRRKTITFHRYLLHVFYFSLGFHWLDIRGRLSREAGILVAAPHTSFFDAAVAISLDIHGSVGRVENAKTPIIGNMYSYSRVIEVDRNDPDSREKTMNEMKQRARSHGLWPRTLVFPEGTTTSGQALITFKIGAFALGEPVQPVSVRYNNPWNTYSWTTIGRSALAQLWFSLCQFHNSLTIEFLPVYFPSDEEKDDPVLYARNVRDVIAEHLEIPVTDHTFEDSILMELSQKLGMHPEVGLIEYQKLRSVLRVNFSEVKEMLSLFAEFCAEDGSLDQNGFASCLGLHNTAALASLFSLYLKRYETNITFRDFVIGHHIISRTTTDVDELEEVSELVFPDKKELNREELAVLLYAGLRYSSDDTLQLFDRLTVNGANTVPVDRILDHFVNNPTEMSVEHKLDNSRDKSKSQ